MLHRGEAAVGGREFSFLQLDESAHLPARIAVGEVEHRIIQRMEAGQGDELEFITVAGDFLLEFGDGGVVEILLPVEARRAVVSQQLARKLRVDGFGELARELQVRLAGFAPDQVGVRRVSQTAADRLIKTVVGFIEAFHRAFAGAERAVVVVDIAGQQVGGFGVGARHDQRRHAHHVGGEARGDQLLHRFAGRHQHLAAHVPALLDASQLVLKMHAGRAGFDHRLHQLERIEHAAETGFGIGHDRLHEIDIAHTFRALDLIRAQQRVVDAFHHLRHGVHGVQRLVGIHLAGDVGVGRDLPAAEIDRLQAGLDLLHRLVAGHRAQRVDKILGL